VQQCLKPQGIAQYYLNTPDRYSVYAVSKNEQAGVTRQADLMRLATGLAPPTRLSRGH
jgi:hypothetical protein